MAVRSRQIMLIAWKSALPEHAEASIIYGLIDHSRSLSSIMIVATAGSTTTNGDGAESLMVIVKLSALSAVLSFTIATLKHCRRLFLLNGWSLNGSLTAI